MTDTNSSVTKTYHYECGKGIADRVIWDIQTLLDKMGLDGHVSIRSLGWFVEGHRWQISGTDEKRVEAAIDSIYDYLGQYRENKRWHGNPL